MRRNVGIDTLRGMAIFLVLGLHYFDLDHVADTGNYNAGGLMNRVFGHGYYGVHIFFVISGYLITSTSMRTIQEDPFQTALRIFYIKRMSRILPLLVIVVFIGSIILYCAKNNESTAYRYLFQAGNAGYGVVFWVSALTFLYNWVEISWVNINHGWFGLQWGILWSLAVEEQFYILFPWFIKMVRTSRQISIAVGFIVAVAVMLRYYLIVNNYEASVIDHNSITCFDALGVGVLVRVNHSWNERNSMLALCIGLFGLGCAYLLPLEQAYGAPVLLVACSAGLIVQGLRDYKMSTLLGVIPILPNLGSLSYGIYLLHPLVFFVLFPFNIWMGMPVWIGFLVTVFMTFCVAKVSYELFEDPIEISIRSRLIQVR